MSPCANQILEFNLYAIVYLNREFHCFISLGRGRYVVVPPYCSISSIVQVAVSRHKILSFTMKITALLFGKRFFSFVLEFSTFYFIRTKSMYFYKIHTKPWYSKQYTLKGNQMHGSTGKTVLIVESSLSPLTRGEGMMGYTKKH